MCEGFFFFFNVAWFMGKFGERKVVLNLNAISSVLCWIQVFASCLHVCYSGGV